MKQKSCLTFHRATRRLKTNKKQKLNSLSLSTYLILYALCITQQKHYNNNNNIINNNNNILYNKIIILLYYNKIYIYIYIYILFIINNNVIIKTPDS